MVGAAPSDAEIWGWLETVPDPEIPAISVVDLGIVRGLRWDQGELVVTVTPTYSGCPATAMIARDIQAALRGKGIARARLETRLSPPWTTDWLSPKGREQLRQTGIAPPAHGRVPENFIAAATLLHPAADTVACPRCGARQTVPVSRFGSTPCKALYRCLECQEPFDYFKPH